jgi:multisubunit Na+/H+ antiporter MnhF subunit
MPSISDREIVVDFWTVAATIMVVGLAVEIPQAISGNPDWALIVAMVGGIISVILHKYPRLDEGRL